MKFFDELIPKVFILAIASGLLIAFLIGMMDFPSADYSNINPLLVLIHEILSLLMLGIFSFIFMLFGSWIGMNYAKSKILEMDKKKES